MQSRSARSNRPSHCNARSGAETRLPACSTAEAHSPPQPPPCGGTCATALQDAGAQPPQQRSGPASAPPPTTTRRRREHVRSRHGVTVIATCCVTPAYTTAHTAGGACMPGSSATCMTACRHAVSRTRMPPNMACVVTSACSRVSSMYFYSICCRHAVSRTRMCKHRTATLGYMLPARLCCKRCKHMFAARTTSMQVIVCISAVKLLTLCASVS